MSGATGVLTINAGSSSIRFAVYDAGNGLRRRLNGTIDRIGVRGTSISVPDSAVGRAIVRNGGAADQRTAVDALLDWFAQESVAASVAAVGHRVVHGARHTEPARITPGLLRELRRITPYAPVHLPREIGLIDAFRQWYPRLPQVACFDTAFHRTMPRVAKLLPIPRRYAAKGVERYGFHGLSYSYVMEELGRLDPAAAKGRVIVAHLGNGASLAAVQHGKCIDTSMGFTPAAGLVMSTRTGDLDPGIAYYLARTERMSAARFQRMINLESGLLGVSGTTSDMQDLLALEASDTRAGDAVALFCYQARRGIGSFAAALGGLETLVFTGGIGENAPTVRRRICESLDFLGIVLADARNARNAARISTPSSRVTVRVIPTDEQLTIARSVVRVLRLDAPQEG